MSKGPSYTRQIVLTVIISVLVLGVITAAVFLWLVPEGVVPSERVYYFTTRLFPLVIGFIMIQVGVILAKRNMDESDMSADPDALPPNSYDRSLYMMPGDDPNRAAAVSGNVIESFESVESVGTEPEEEAAPTIIIKPAAPEEKPEEEAIEPFVPPLAPEEEAEPAAEEPAVEEPEAEETEAVEEIAEAEPEVVPVVAAPAEDEEAAEEEEVEFDYILSEVLPREIESALEYEYSLTLVSVTTQFPEKVLKLSEANGIPFEKDDSIVVIFPFFNKDEAEDELAEIKAASTDSRFRYKLSELNGRSIDADTFLSEI